MMNHEPLPENVAVFRRFNRFYTKQIGLLNQGLLATPFTLTKARILFEIAHHQRITASDLIRELSIDAGYLSRILDSFRKAGLISRKRSPSDSRRRFLELTPRGSEAFADLNERSTQQAEALLQPLTDVNRHRLIQAMQRIVDILETGDRPAAPILLRHPEPGEIGWMIQRHGELYKEEYGWDETFETLVADILVRFIQSHNPERERIWIAEQAGKRTGMIMVVDAGNGVAQLRLLLVEPWARGQGLGKRLIDTCVDFARQRGFRKIKLWTQSILLEARHLYKKAGFTRTEEQKTSGFGYDLVSETWELHL